MMKMKTWWSVGFVLVGLGFNLSCFSAQRKDRLVVRNGIDVSYAGKHRDHPQVRQLFEDFPNIRKNVYHRLRRRTGLWPKDGQAIVVRLEDRQWRHGKAMAWMSPRSLAGKDIVLLNYYTDAYLKNPGIFKDVLAHEITHAIMYQLMGPRRFRSLPTWVKEGAASWAAGEVPRRLRSSVCYKNMKADEIMDGLERREYQRTFHQGKDYLEDALVFDYVAKVHGMDNLRKLYQYIVEGKQPELAFKMATSLSWREVKDRTNEYARTAISQVDCSRKRTRVSGLRDLMLHKKYTEARGQLQAFLSQSSDSSKAPQALLWLGICHLGLRSLPQAVEAFEQVLAHPQANEKQRQHAQKYAESARRCLEQPTCAAQGPKLTVQKPDFDPLKDVKPNISPPSLPAAAADE